MILRGGGCGGVKSAGKASLQRQSLLADDEQHKLAYFISENVEIISKNAKLAESQSEKLNSSFQFFNNNRRDLWKIKDVNKVAALFTIISQSMTPLIQALEYLIIGHPQFAFKLAKIISSLSWVLFQYYLDRDTKNCIQEAEQKDLLEKIAKIEELVGNEKNVKTYQNNLQYEIFIFKSIIMTCPNDSTEGQDILIQFLQGAGQSIATFKLSDDFLQSLVSGVKFLYKEHEKASSQRLLKIIFGLIDLTFSTIEEIEKNSKNQRGGETKFEYLSQLNTMYDKVVSQSSDWQVQCAWTQALSQIFQHKLIIPANEFLQLGSSVPSFCHQKSNNYWLNIENIEFEKDHKFKLLYQNLPSLQELGRFQYIVLNGYQKMPGLETLYFSKLASQIDDQKQNLFEFNLHTVSLMLHQAQQSKELIANVQKQINLLNIENLLKINDIDSNIQKTINCNIFLLESIQGLNEFETKQIQYNSSLKNRLQDSWYQEDFIMKKRICKEFTQFYIKIQTIMNEQANEKYIFDHQKEFIFKKQKEDSNQIIKQQNQEQEKDDKTDVAETLKEIEEKITEPLKEQKQTKSYNQIITQLYKDFDKKDKSEQTTLLVQLQEKLKLCGIKKSKFYRSNKDHFQEGFNQGVKFIKQVESFIKWNLRILMFLKFHIKVILNEKYSKDILSSNIVAIKQVSQQLSTQKSAIKAINYFYKMFQGCEKFKIEFGQKNPIYNILHTIIIRKFQTQNILMHIYKYLIKKICEQDDVNISQQIFAQIQLDIEEKIQDIQQLSRATSMINDLIKSRNQKVNTDSEDFKLLYDKMNFEIKFVQPLNQSQWSKNRTLQFKLQEFQYEFNRIFKTFQNKYKDKEKKQLETQQTQIQNLLEKIEILQSYQNVTPEDVQVLSGLVDKINKEVIKIQETYNYQLIQDTGQIELIEKPEIKNKSIFETIQDVLLETEHNLIVQLENLKFINKPQGKFLQLIHNFFLLQQNEDIRKEFEANIKSNKNEVKLLIEEYQKILPTQILECNKLEGELKKAQFKFTLNLQSEIYFILTQIGKKQEEDITTDPSYIDRFKEAASDFITKNRWRIRQSCIIELLMFRKSCLSQETLNQCNALLVKYKIYETDPRNQLLLTDYSQEQLEKMISQCWSLQEEDIQNKIKEKLEELNDIAYKYTIETNQNEKKKLKSCYLELQTEIQGIIENAEGLGNSIGMSVLFFQDLKRDLINVQAQLKTLQGQMDTISKDIQYLKGRTVKDLLQMRMQRVLQQRLIINSENVYISLKTRERFILEGYEDDETPLLTEDLFSNGEINEFIWKQQKLSFLIHGKAGSGKSTAARKIEEFLWQLYKKNMGIPESIPIIPIFISLPSLKDPQNLAMEETLKSDNYRFNEKQVAEFLEAVENGEFKLVIIMDSYDELNSQYIGSNLYQSNKLFKWRSKDDQLRFPKVITTSRSEIFTNNDYKSYFLSESENLRYYKEVRLQNFSQKQVQEYIEQHQILNVKKVIKEIYFNSKPNLGFFEFEEFFEEILDIINSSPKKIQSIERINIQESLLSQDCINKIIDKCNLGSQDDDGIKIQQQLTEIWSVESFQKLISEMDINGLLETPFMIEIVTYVLPQMIKQRQDIFHLKEQFIKTFEDDSKIISAQDMWQKIINNDKFIKEFSKCFKDTDLLDLISKHFSDLFQQNTLEPLKKSLRLDPLCSYDFYQQFFQQYFKKQINKLREAGETMQYVQNDSELWEFTHRLANEMTVNNLTQVQFQQKGLIFKNQKEDWRDLFFNDNCEQGPVKIQFRRVMPLKQKFGVYSFQHKSLQEFLVAKWIIEFLDQYDEENEILQGFDLEHEVLPNVSFCSDFMKGTVKFIVDKLKFDVILQEKMLSIVYLSSKQKEMYQSQNNGMGLKNSMKISVRQSQNIRKSKQTNERSSYDGKIIKAASNCLYLLHLMKYQFSDLKKITIEDIELIGSNFFQADLSCSNFSRVNLSKSNFNATNLNNIVWDNIAIDELPKIKTEEEIGKIFYYNAKDDTIVYKSEENKLTSYNYKTGEKKISNFLIHRPEKKTNLKNIFLNQNNDQIILILEDWDIIIANLDETINCTLKIDMTEIEPEEFILDQQNCCLSGNGQYLSSGTCGANYIIQLKNQREKQNENQSDFNCLKPKIISEEYCVQMQWITDVELILLMTNELIIYNANTGESKTLQSKKFEIYEYSCVEILQARSLMAISFSIKSANYPIIKVLDQLNQILKIGITNLLDKEGYEIALEVQQEEMRFLKFVESEKYLLCFSSLNQKIIMRLWNFREKKLISSNIIDSKSILKPLILPNSLIATVTQDKGIIQIWDLKASFLQQNEKINVVITSAIFVQNLIVTGNNTGAIQIWDENKGAQVGKDLKEHKTEITCFEKFSERFEENEISRLISCDSKGYLVIWNLLKQELQGKYFLINAIESIAKIKDKDNFITLSKNYFLQIWNKDFSEYNFLLKQQYINSQKQIKFILNNPLSMLDDCQDRIEIDDTKNQIHLPQNITFFTFGCKAEQLLVTYKDDKKKQCLKIYEEDASGYLVSKFFHNLDSQSDVITIKETADNVLIVTETEIFQVKQKQIEKVHESSQVINDAIMDEDLLFMCSNNEIFINNLHTKKIAVQQPIDSEFGSLQKITIFKKNNILFVGTSTGVLIQYELLTLKPNKKQIHKKSIINLQIIKEQNYLITCGEDQNIVVWSLINSEKDYLEVINQLNYREQIHQFWYDETCNFFFISSKQKDDNYFQLQCLMWDFERTDSDSYKCPVQKIQNNQLVSFVERRQQIYIATPSVENKPFKLQKVFLLQEQLKRQIYHLQNFTPHMMIYCQGMIIIVDYNGKIYHWNDVKGELFDNDFKLGNTDESIIERYVYDYSERQNRLVFFYLQRENASPVHQIKIFSLDNQIMKLVEEFSIMDENGGNFVGSKINSVNFLSSDDILITFINYQYESLTVSISKKSIKDQINDHFGELKGSVSKEKENIEESCFITYGMYNQISYYEYVTGKQSVNDQKVNGFCEKFRFGDSIQKFSCQKALVETAVVKSNHGIDITRLFGKKSNVNNNDNFNNINNTYIQQQQYSQIKNRKSLYNMDLDQVLEASIPKKMDV